MTKQEFLAFSLPYGLKTIRRTTSDDMPIYSIISLFYESRNLCRIKTVDGQGCFVPISIIMPILHPLSDLDSYNSNSPMNLTMTHLICTSYSLQRLIENRIAINTLSMGIVTGKQIGRAHV